MKNRLFSIILMLAALTSVTFFMHAHPSDRGHRSIGAHAGFFDVLHRLDELKAELGLTDAQTDAIKAIVRETHRENKGFRARMHGTLMEVANTLLTNPNDIAGAQAVLDRQAEAERALKTNLVTAASKAVSVLTPEQRTKLARHLAERDMRRGHHGH